MKKLLILPLLGLLAFQTNTSTDIDGNESKEVTIGEQVWMVKNLNVDKFRNGDPIPEAKTDEEWERAGERGEPAWCCYDNDPANGEKYGKLYNWYAVSDTRGLSPLGYHVPTDAEWTILEDHLSDDVGEKMKSISGWNEDRNGTNESGFSGLPGGLRDLDGSFKYVGGNGDWWSSTEYSTEDSWGRSLGYVDGVFFRYHDYKFFGFSVRCLRD